MPERSERPFPPTRSLGAVDTTGANRRRLVVTLVVGLALLAALIALQLVD